MYLFFIILLCFFTGVNLLKSYVSYLSLYIICFVVFISFSSFVVLKSCASSLLAVI